MKILILGGDGMLGHQLLRRLSVRHDCRVTLRQDLAAYGAYGLFRPNNAFGGIEVRAIDRLAEVVDQFRPDAIVNAVGIVKQRASSTEAIPSLEINALLPHRLAALAKEIGARLVHFSTDCVFSGRVGHYVEGDFPDANDLYGRTKLLGEVIESHCITLRTSIVGRELSRKKNLVEWFLAQRGMVQGYRRAVFSGFTTIEMSRIVEAILLDHPGAHGIWHVGSEPIDKYAMLDLVRRRAGLDVKLVPDDEFVCDRSLDSTAFRQRFGYRPPAWEGMIEELVADWEFYESRSRDTGRAE